MNILIVETTWMGGQRYKFLDKTLLSAFSILPTLQARQLAAITPKHHTVTVANERYAPIDFTVPYDMVNINFVTSTAPRAYQIADTFREKGICVVLSGVHASGIPEEAQRHGDSILIGKCEASWLQLLDDFEGWQLKPIYMPVPLDATIHIPPTNVRLPRFMMTAAVEATRGCPYRCEFCPENNTTKGSLYYERPVDDVIEEIKNLPQKTVMFSDTSLTIHPSYSKDLFKKMKGLHKKFFCNGNVDVLAKDEEFVRLSKEAGCITWLVGFESISQPSLDAMNKTTNRVEEYEKAVHNIHKHGMVVIGCFIFGFDTDNPQVFHDTVDNVKRMKIDVAEFYILTPMPGTPLFQRLDKEERILTKDWGLYNMGNVVFSPKQMSNEELKNGVRHMYHEFYSPIVSLQRITRSLRRGLYPFFVVLARNMIASMSSRRVHIKK